MLRGSGTMGGGWGGKCCKVSLLSFLFESATLRDGRVLINFKDHQSDVPISSEKWSCKFTSRDFREYKKNLFKTCTGKRYLVEHATNILVFPEKHIPRTP